MLNLVNSELKKGVRLPLIRTKKNGHVFTYKPSEIKEINQNKHKLLIVGHKLFYFMVAPKGAVLFVDVVAQLTARRRLHYWCRIHRPSLRLLRR